MEREKTRGELIAERLEKEADARVPASHTYSAPRWHSRRGQQDPNLQAVAPHSDGAHIDVD